RPPRRQRAPHAPGPTRGPPAPPPTRHHSWLARFKGLDPQAKVTFVNPVNGVTNDVTTVSGHRGRLRTDCPGRTCTTSSTRYALRRAENSSRRDGLPTRITLGG
ncbi:hypothetical protein ACWGJB_20285, partial [Streptomyces sp. NPDC054813]